VKQIRILMAEDHHLVRHAIADFLSREQDITIVGEVGDTNNLVKLIQQLEPDLLLLDANIPGPNIVELTQQLCSSYPLVNILILSAFDRREHVLGLLRAGASGYVLKDERPETLIHAIHVVASGEEWLSPRVSQVLLNSIRNNNKGNPPKLTPREKEVLELIVQGASNDDIALDLVITTNTVKNHVRNIFRKLDVQTRVEAVITALNQHIIEKP